MVNKKIYTKSIYKNYLFFGLDELEFTLENSKKDIVFFNDLELNIDFDNSNVWYIEIFDLTFTYTKTYIKWYNYWLIFHLSIDWLSIPCFSIFFWKETNFKWKQGKSKDKVVIYSSFFVLEKLWKLDFTIQQFVLINFINPELYRLDIALDLPYTIKELQKTLFKWTEFFSAIWRDIKHSEFHQTYYIKNPQSSQNRKYIIRIYDKILDTWKKKKHFLYPHLQKSTDVRRIELELRPIEADRLPYTIEEILENKDNCISKIFFTYLNKNINPDYIKEDINLELKKYTNQKINLKEQFLKTKHIPKDYVSRVNWYLQNIYTTTGFEWLIQTIYNLQFISWYDLNKKQIILTKQPNYNFIIQLFEQQLKYLLKNNIISERKLIFIFRKNLKTKITIKIKNKP